jgi:hypothetical protein
MKKKWLAEGAAEFDRRFDFYPLYGDFNELGRIRGMPGFHHFKPSFDSFPDVADGFIVGSALRETARKGRYFGDIIARLILFYSHMQFHSFSLLRNVSYL